MSNLPMCGKDGPIYSTAMGCSGCILRLRASLAHNRGWRRYLEMSADLEALGQADWFGIFASSLTTRGLWQFQTSTISTVVYSCNDLTMNLQPLPSSKKLILTSTTQPPFSQLKGPPRPPAVSLVLTMAKGNSATATCNNLAPHSPKESVGLKWMKG